MNNDKHDTLALIGRLLKGKHERDAIHVAVAPIIAGEPLEPGSHVGIVNGKATSQTHDVVGVIDPFLKRSMVAPGEQVWLFLYPGSITGLRHDWEHPKFPQDGRPFIPAGASAEERRLREIADEIGIDYSEMMYGADEWVSTSVGSRWGGEYLTQHGSDSWRDAFPAYVNEFWRLYEIVRGKSVPDEHKQSFFSCSC